MNARSQEVQGIKETLNIIEKNDLFARDARHHRVRRQDIPDFIVEELEVEEEEEAEPEAQDEARGWKNGEKKKNKKNKKHKHAEEEVIVTEPVPELPPASEDAKDMNAAKANSLEVEEEKKEMARDPFTSGIQFSAYSGGEARPTYKPARATRPPPAGPENRFMYGLDLNGNPQYMDEAAVSMLLQNPQAKKVNIGFTFLISLTFKMQI
jgi:hypothetical protein